jgi:surface polysaccharide O-acyltransferase-like enzyme
VAVAAVQGFWPAQPIREVILTIGILLLVWVPSIRTPRLVARVSGVLASASLYIYLTHWQVYPALRGIDPWLAVAGSIAVGLLYWQLVGMVSARIRVRRVDEPRGQRSP